MADPFIDFAGKWIVVSGASSGLGRAAAIELSRRGAMVIASGRDEGRLDETLAALEAPASGDDPHRKLVLDLTDHAAITPAIVALRKELGAPIHGLCHSAGIAETRPLASTDHEIIQSQLDVNLVAALELARAVCRRNVMDPDGGSVVFISSLYGHVGMSGQIAYCASKSALYGAARAMAIELARRNIRVNTISPGLVLTEMTKKALDVLSEDQVEKLRAAHPLRTGTPDDVARAVAFLLAPQSGWITGTDLRLDGGFSAQ